MLETLYFQLFEVNWLFSVHYMSFPQSLCTHVNKGVSCLKLCSATRFANVTRLHDIPRARDINEIIYRQAVARAASFSCLL